MEKTKKLFGIKTKLLYLTETLLAKEMKESHVLMNKPVYFGMSIPELSKSIIHEKKLSYVTWIQTAL